MAAYTRAGRSGSYVYGNTVSQPVYEPQKRRQKDAPVRRKNKTSVQVRRNRRNATFMNSAYLLFLTLAVVAAMITCVRYVKLRSDIEAKSVEITQLQENLTTLKEANDTKYNAIMDSVNLDEIRTEAMTKLGMVYADSSQIVEYENPSTDYVTQYESIPEDGVVADSSDKSK